MTENTQTAPRSQTAQTAQNAETPRPVVVGVDTSDNAARAADWAARYAAALGLPLLVVNALDLPATPSRPVEPAGYTEHLREDGAKLVSRIAARLRERFPELAIETEVSELSAAHTLVKLSETAGLVVTGTRGHGGFAGMLLGSVSHRTAAHAHAPVVVVRGERPGEPVDEIVLGVEPGEADAPIRFAFATAAQFGATVRAVRVWEPFPVYGGYYVEDADGPEYARKDVEQLIKKVRDEYPGVEVSIEASRGNPVTTLLETARGARLLVIGAHRHRAPLSIGTGYVVQGLLSHAPTPVAVVPIV